VPVTKKSTTTKKKAGDGATGAVKVKRSIKAKVAGGPKRGGRSPPKRATAATGVDSRGEPAPAAARDPARAAAARSAALKAVILRALDDMKAWEIKVLDVRGVTDVADTMVIASGTSDRHVRAVAQKLVEQAKAAGFRPQGIEGQQESDWILIDLNEIVVHVMLPRVREFYGLEKLWDMTQPKRAHRA
jgi:ribosome silencing factor RsfS/YbeB/iojap